MAEIVIDANVIVGHLYAADAQHGRTEQLLDRLERDGHEIVLLDFLVQEAVSVLCRRAAERKTDPPDLKAALEVVRGWYDGGEVRFIARDAEKLAGDVLDVILETAAVLNFNDALVVVLERQGAIDHFASFDGGFDGVEGFQRLS
jgi:predicted nucleic acid-binding protein